MNLCFKCQKPIESEEPTHGLHPLCFQAWFGLPPHDSTEFENIALKREAHDSERPNQPLNTSFFHGKFKKYSATLQGRSYILKVQDDRFKELPHTEFLSNQIAQSLKLPIPDFYLVSFLNTVDTFVVHNFMDHYRPGNLVHIYHFLKMEESFSCQTIIRIIEEKVGRLEAIQQFVFLCLFDALIGNHDRHGRNIAFIETRKGFVLAPFYDNPSYIGIEEYSLLRAHHSPKGKIATSTTQEPSMQDYVYEFKKMGYISWLEDFKGRVYKAPLMHLVQNSYLTEKRKQAFSDLITRRLKEFDHALSA